MLLIFSRRPVLAPRSTAFGPRVGAASDGGGVWCQGAASLAKRRRTAQRWPQPLPKGLRGARARAEAAFPLQSEFPYETAVLQ